MIRVSDKRLAEWFRQVSDALSAGMNATNAVALARPLPRRGGEAMSDAFKRGLNWTGAFEAVDLALTASERAILAAAETSGSLPASLLDLAENREDSAATKRRIVMAMLYPLFLIHFAALAFAARHLVDGAYAEFAVAAAMVLAPIWALAFFLLILQRYLPSGLKALGRFLPLFSGYIRTQSYGVLARTLAACFRAGMPVERAWEAAILAAENGRVRRLGELVLQAVRSGEPASRGMERAGSLAPHSLLQLYRTGEETGSLEQNVSSAADSFLKSAKSKLLAASLAYPGLVLAGVFAYVIFQILQFYMGYFEQIQNLGS